MSLSELKGIVGELAEDFSEAQIDMDRAIYDQLAPHVNQLTEKVNLAVQSVEGITTNMELVKLLLSGRVVIQRQSLRELMGFVEDRSSQRNDWRLTVDINADLTPTMVLPTTPERETAEPVIDTRYLVNMSTYANLRNRFSHEDISRVARVVRTTDVSPVLRDARFIADALFMITRAQARAGAEVEATRRVPARQFIIQDYANE